MDVKFGIRGVDKVKEFMASLPRGIKQAAMIAMSEYIIGDERHGLKFYPPRVDHDKSNPYQWQSEKQRRAFFATNGFGRGIPTKRTDTLKNAWTVTTQDSNWTMVKIENKSGYAPFVQGDWQQRGHAADKWRKFGQVVTDNLKGAFQQAMFAVNKFLKSK